jgi:hypothetical protein
MFSRKSKLMLAGAALFIAALACGGGSPATIADIPVFPGASVMQPGDNEMADILSETIADTATTEGVNAEVILYRLPDGTSFQDLAAFFDGALADTDWDPDASLYEETEFFSSAGWLRGGLASEQALILAYSEDPFDGVVFYMIGLFSE